MPTTAAELREIAAGSESRIHKEFFAKYLDRAIQGIQSAAKEGDHKCTIYISELKHFFMAPDLIAEIQKEFPGVVITTRDNQVGSFWITVSWEA